MKVILKADVKDLGKMGDIVTAAPGYARNYLIPNDFAAPANTKNVKALEHQKKVIADKKKKLHEGYVSFAEKLSTTSITIKARAGEEEKLFGSVTSMDIAEALKAEGVELDKKKISLEEPIKRLGEHEVQIKVAPEVTASLKVKVVSE
jgi:large subunit ribosomal protein L9